MDDERRPTYDPSIFDVDTLDRAKWVILNPDGVHSPDQRWQIETDYLLNILDAYLPIKDATCLDYGCGIGRLVKPLIERKQWTVVGADISSSMRAFAARYVNSPNFLACDPCVLDLMVRCGVQFDFALAVWTLQHCKDVHTDIARIARALKPSGRLFVLNSTERYLPTREHGWVGDEVNVLDILNRKFQVLELCRADTTIIPAPPTLWGVFEKPVQDNF